MDLNKLLPNKTLLWKEWKNNGILMVVFALIVTQRSTYDLLKAIFLHHKAIRQGLHTSAGEVLYSYLMFNIGDFLTFQSYSNAATAIIFMFFVVILGAFMVGRERDHKTYDLLLGLPYSRFDIMHNKFVMGLGLLVTIFALNAALMSLLVLLNSGIDFPFGVSEIWSWAGINIVVLGFIFAFTMLISSLSGTTIGNVLLSFIFLFFPAGLISLVALNFDFWNLFDFVHKYNSIFKGLSEFGIALTAPLYLMEISIINEVFRVPGYIIMFILIFALYYITQKLFSGNRLENNGEVLMFQETEGFFKMGVVACFTLLLGPVFLYILGVNRVYDYLILGALSYLLSGILVWYLVNLLIKSRRAV